MLKRSWCWPVPVVISYRHGCTWRRWGEVAYNGTPNQGLQILHGLKILGLEYRWLVRTVPYDIFQCCSLAVSKLAQATSHVACRGN